MSLRCAVFTLLAIGCASDAPRLTKFSGRTIDRDDATIELAVCVGDRLLIAFETAASPGRSVWVWTLDAPTGWDVNPRTGEGRWDVLPGTPADVTIPVLVASGRDGRGPSRGYTIVATVGDRPEDTAAPIHEEDR